MAFVPTAGAVTTDVQSPGNTAGARYNSTYDQFTIWDNLYESDTYSMLQVTNVANGSSRTYSHAWTGSGSPSRTYALPSSWTSGQELRFFVCERSGFDGSALGCSGTARAWV
ncbi:hypothetical protein AB0E77_33300 [Streptomyces sp. NPDC032940]|uniref:hypothetical protein n=1 Tax=Streptomyces sp. NPDC032940 TaxID=3155366 RepID=UPI0033F6EBBD